MNLFSMFTVTIVWTNFTIIYLSFAYSLVSFYPYFAFFFFWERSLFSLHSSKKYVLYIGYVAVQCQSGDEEIPHVQGQKSPSKMVGTGTVAAWCWSDCEELPHIQEQRRSPSKMGGGSNLHLKSNLIATRNAQRAQTNLVFTRTQRLHRDWDRTVCEHLLWRYGSAVVCTGPGAQGVGMA